MKQLKDIIFEKLHLNKHTHVTDVDEMLIIADTLMKGIDYNSLTQLGHTITKLSDNFNKHKSDLNDIYIAVSAFEYPHMQENIIDEFKNKQITPKLIKEYGNVIILNKDFDSKYYINIFINHHTYADLYKKTQDSKLYLEHSDKKIFISVNTDDKNYKVYSATNIKTQLN